jgi:hypothetical protein
MFNRGIEVTMHGKAVLQRLTKMVGWRQRCQRPAASNRNELVPLQLALSEINEWIGRELTNFDP